MPSRSSKSMLTGPLGSSRPNASRLSLIFHIVCFITRQIVEQLTTLCVLLRLSLRINTYMGAPALVVLFVNVEQIAGVFALRDGLERVHVCEIKILPSFCHQFLDVLHIFRDFTSGNCADYVVGHRIGHSYAEFARAIFCFEFAFRLCEKPPFGLCCASTSATNK